LIGHFLPVDGPENSPKLFLRFCEVIFHDIRIVVNSINIKLEWVLTNSTHKHFRTNISLKVVYFGEVESTFQTSACSVLLTFNFAHFGYFSSWRKTLSSPV